MHPDSPRAEQEQEQLTTLGVDSWQQAWLEQGPGAISRQLAEERRQ